VGTTTGIHNVLRASLSPRVLRGDEPGPRTTSHNVDFWVLSSPQALRPHMTVFPKNCHPGQAPLWRSAEPGPRVTSHAQPPSRFSPYPTPWQGLTLPSRTTSHTFTPSRLTTLEFKERGKGQRVSASGLPQWVGRVATVSFEPPPQRAEKRRDAAPSRDFWHTRRLRPYMDVGVAPTRGRRAPEYTESVCISGLHPTPLNKTPLKQRPPRELSGIIVRDVLGPGIRFLWKTTMKRRARIQLVLSSTSGSVS
jgi:hypothetical protein